MNNRFAYGYDAGNGLRSPNFKRSVDPERVCGDAYQARDPDTPVSRLPMLCQQEGNTLLPRVTA